MLKSCYCCGAPSSHPMKDCSIKDAECYKCGKKDISRVVTSPGKRKRTMESQNLQKNMNWLHKHQWNHRHSRSMQLHISKQHTTTNLPKVKSLEQHSTICRQYRSTAWTSRRTTGVTGHFGCQHNSMHRTFSLTVSLTQQQGVISCACTSTGHCIATRNQGLSQFSSVDMVTPQWKGCVQ